MDYNDIFSIQNKEDFLQRSLETFRYQAVHSSLYKQYIENLSIKIDQVKALQDIPFLPIEFFKTHKIITEDRAENIIFSSSGTTGSSTSAHYVSDLSLYEDSFNKAFRLFYGEPKHFAILALLPSYLERSGSSLIYMVDELIKQSVYPESGYFLYNHDDLSRQLSSLKEKNIPTILFGVTYALLDFIEQHSLSFPELIIMETGGMKGKRKEMVREELHEILKQGFDVPAIHSEYGMTELLSQAYSRGDGKFSCPPWMNVLVRELNDPFSYRKPNQTGGINVIDLANINSCSFIATQDLGRKFDDNSFEILGRFDQSDIRGCNLLVQ